MRGTSAEQQSVVMHSSSTTSPHMFIKGKEQIIFFVPPTATGSNRLGLLQGLHVDIIELYIYTYTAMALCIYL